MTEPCLLDDQLKLVDALRRLLEQDGETAQLYETHISWVLVCAGYAYKIKKGLRFDFLDFSTLGQRRYYCLQELRLNRRLAPDWYLEVVALTGTAARPRLVAADAVEETEAREYALKMRAFSQQGLWRFRIGQGMLGADEIDQLARKLIRFHAEAARAPAASDWGAPETVRQFSDDNLKLIEQLASAPAQVAAVAALRRWQDERLERLSDCIAARKAGGAVRECHGDLHTGNIFTHQGKVEVFDCIEFNERLRWIDVLQDLAFICMDLRLRGCVALAARLLNACLEHSGDYAALALHHFYQTECALVRWKIALARERQAGEAPAGGVTAVAGAAVPVPGAAVPVPDAAPDIDPSADSAAALMAYAVASIGPCRPVLIAMHGLAGSGKSSVARQLVEWLDAVQIRSDVERKRMVGIAPGARTGTPDAPGAGRYQRAERDAVYDRLRVLAAALLGAGKTAVVDAGFLNYEQRRSFADLAAASGVPFLIVDVHAREQTLRARLRNRQQEGRDASDAGEAVLAYQYTQQEPLRADEAAHVLSIDSEAASDPAAVRSACLARLTSLAANRPRSLS
jgi:aminoglycoside phosphotransferase family enzyme/predicted kinase